MILPTLGLSRARLKPRSIWYLWCILFFLPIYNRPLVAMVLFLFVSYRSNHELRIVTNVYKPATGSYRLIEIYGPFVITKCFGLYLFNKVDPKRYDSICFYSQWHSFDIVIRSFRRIIKKKTAEKNDRIVIKHMARLGQNGHFNLKRIKIKIWIVYFTPVFNVPVPIKLHEREIDWFVWII